MIPVLRRPLLLALCRTIKDRRETGGKDLQAMLVPNRDDKLVGWGWEPGSAESRCPYRASASSRPGRNGWSWARLVPARFPARRLIHKEM